MSYRLIVVGKTDTGKSSTCNTLVGGERFEADGCANAVTTSCKSEKNDDLGLTVVDTPGLCDSEGPLRQRALEIQKSVLEMCKEPHAFLLVYKLGRFTNDDKITINLLEIIFGPNVFDHSIVVLTYGCKNCKRKGSTNDELSQGFDECDERNYNENEDKELKMFYCKNKVILSLVKRCKDRVVRIENDVENQCSIHTTERMYCRLMSYVKSVSLDGKNVFKNDFIDTHRQTLETHIEKYDSLQEEITALQKTLNENLERARAEELQRYMIKEIERKERKEIEKREREEETKRKKEEKEKRAKEKREKEEQEKKEKEEKEKRDNERWETFLKFRKEENEEWKRKEKERNERERRDRTQRDREENERNDRERIDREETERLRRENKKFQNVVKVALPIIGGASLAGAPGAVVGIGIAATYILLGW